MNFDAAVDHMNGDHQDDSVTICSSLGGLIKVSQAKVTKIDVDGVEFEAITKEGTEYLRLSWSTPITERNQVRERIVELYDRASELSPK